MLLKFGGLVVDGRGSVGGTTFSRNRYGAYARARITPVNPKTPRQSVIRAIVAAVTIRWLGSLSQAQRDAWAVFASNVPAKNKLGEVINLSGFNQFSKSNIVADNAGLTSINDAPIVFDLPGEDPGYSTEVDAGTGKITVVFTDNKPWVTLDEAGLIVQMGIPVNNSIGFFDGPWRHAGVILGDNVSPPTSPDSTIDVAFPVGDGQRVYTRAKIILPDGRVSDWFRSNSIVATA